MKADSCVHALKNALNAYLSLEGAIIYSDRRGQDLPKGHPRLPYPEKYEQCW